MHMIVGVILQYQAESLLRSDNVLCKPHMSLWWACICYRVELETFGNKVFDIKVHWPTGLSVSLLVKGYFGRVNVPYGHCGTALPASAFRWFPHFTPTGSQLQCSGYSGGWRKLWKRAFCVYHVCLARGVLNGSLRNPTWFNTIQHHSTARVECFNKCWIFSTRIQHHHNTTKGAIQHDFNTDSTHGVE